MWSGLGLLLAFVLCGVSGSRNQLETARKLAELSCHIARTQAAQITYIYRCVSCPIEAFMPHVALEQTLHQCVASHLPSCMRSLEAHEVEPLRHSDSMNIFLIPAGDDGQPIAQRILNMLNPLQMRRHFHKYLFVWPEASDEQLKQLFAGCWKKQLLPALAISRPKHIHDFQPFGEAGLQLIEGNSLPYYKDKLKDLHGFELRFSMFKHPLRALPLSPVETAGYDAIDGSVARLITQHLNATARYVAPNDDEAYGRCLPNGSFTGVVRDLAQGKTHMALNLRFILDCFEQHIESVYPYARSIICLVVPAAEMRPEYMIFVTAFRRSVWHLLLVNFLFVGLLFGLLQRLLRSFRNERVCSWLDILEMLTKTHLGQPVEHFSNISSLRYFLMSWIMFSYVFTSIYFAKLESNFVQPNYEQQLDNLNDLPALDLRVHGINSVFEAIEATISKRHYQILTDKQWVHPLKDSSYFYELAVSRWTKKAAFLMRDDMAREFLSLTYNPQTERPTYHIVKQYLRSMPSTYILPLGSPFRHKIQTLLGALYEHGFFEYWWRMDVLERSRSSSSDEFFEDLGEQTEQLSDGAKPAGDEKDLRKKRVVLTLGILQGAFYFWLIGIALSLLGFALEQIYFYWQSSQRALEINV